MAFAVPPNEAAVSAATAFDQRSSAAVAQIAANIDRGVVDTAGNAVGSQKASQIEEDAKLAEQLQAEEYEAAERRQERRRARAGAAPEQNNENNSSWYDWIVGGTSNTAAAATPPNSNASNTTAPTPTPGGARVAQKQASIFACVVGAVDSAVNGPRDVHGIDSASLLT